MSSRGRANVDTRPWTFSAPARLSRTALQRLILFPLVSVLTPTTVIGRDRLRTAPSRVIVVANHVSHLDTPVILKALPRRIRNRLVVAAARDYFYGGRLRGALVSLSLATIPFDRGMGSPESLAECGELLEHDWSLLLFPEGTRSRSGVMGRVRRGAAVLACDTGTPLLPLYVHGLADVMPKGTIAPMPGGVAVMVGHLIIPDGDIEATRDRIEAEMMDLASQEPVWRSPSTKER